MCNIIIFGQTGAGKSSLINLLARNNVAPTSSKLSGGTESNESFKISPSANKTYTFWDTPGLNEDEQGTVPAKQAMDNLCNLVNEIRSVNLIIYCIRGPRLPGIVRVNYDLFCGIICEGKVPIVLVVTGLEQESNMDQWWAKYEKDIKKMDMTFEGHACVTTTKGRNNLYEQEYLQSADKVWTLVQKHCLPDPLTLTAEWISEVPTRIEAYVREYNARTGRERKHLPKIQHHGKGSLPTNITHNVIIFGESGSGKSSIVNMIMDQDIAAVSSGPTGCTFKNECYETRIADKAYRIYDTVGLNEGDQGRVPHWKAIQGLYTLIRRLDGVSLLVFCMRGRVRENSRANWCFFFDLICGKNVPVIAAVTGSENEDFEYHETMKAFNQYHMFPRDIVPVVSIFGKNNEHRTKYEESQEALRRLIEKHRRPEPWSKEKDQWFSQIYQNAYELRICFFAKTRLEFNTKMREAFDEFIRNSNIKEEDFDMLTATLIQAEKNVAKSKLFYRK